MKNHSNKPVKKHRCENVSSFSFRLNNFFCHLLKLASPNIFLPSFHQLRLMKKHRKKMQKLLIRLDHPKIDIIFPKHTRRVSRGDRV